MTHPLPVFDDLDEADLDWLASVGTVHAHPRGCALVEAGRPIDALCLLLEGACAAHLKTRKVARILPGEIFGEVSFLDGRRPTVDVTAVDDVVVLELPRAALEARLRENPPFAARFYHGLAVMLASRLRTAVATFDDEEGDVDTLDDPAVERFREMARTLLRKKRHR